MTPADIVRAAIPGAPDSLCEHVLWGMTPFPCGPVTAQDLWRAASRYKRATDHGRVLCEFCDREAEKGKWVCARCKAALSDVRKSREGLA